MGMSIDLHIYDYFELVKDIGREVKEKASADLPADRTVNDFVERVLPEFGMRTGDKYVTLWCEYYSDSGYNAASELFRAVELYFGIDDVFLDGYDTSSGANAHEVLDDLGIAPIGEEDDEDY